MTEGQRIGLRSGFLNPRTRDAKPRTIATSFWRVVLLTLLEACSTLSIWIRTLWLGATLVVMLAIAPTYNVKHPARTSRLSVCHTETQIDRHLRMRVS